jgi:secreted protein with Ig-like and vWFA domain
MVISILNYNNRLFKFLIDKDMNTNEKRIYDQEIEKKKDTLWAEIDLSNQAMKECSKRVEEGTESITTLMAMQKQHNFTLKELSALLNKDRE